MNFNPSEKIMLLVTVDEFMIKCGWRDIATFYYCSVTNHMATILLPEANNIV